MDQKPVLQQMISKKQSRLGLDTHREELKRALSYKLYSGYREATEEDGNEGTPEIKIWSEKWGQHDSSTTGGRWKWRLETDLDGEKWSQAYVCDNA